MEINRFPPQEPRTAIDPLVCTKGATLRALGKTVEIRDVFEGHLSQTTLQHVAYLVAPAKSYG